MKSGENAVIIVSGGSGTRMRSDLPKQYLEVNGKPIIVWTLEKFLLFDPEVWIVLVLGHGHEQYWEPIKEGWFSHNRIVVTEGGEKRYDSVKNGLKIIDRDCIIGIHDAVRPMVNVETIRRCYHSARKYGSGIPVVAVEDSIRSEMEGKNAPVMRDTLKRVQTPQVFRAGEILKAYEQPFNRFFTDDASVYEAMFRSVRLVEGNTENIKITHQSDLIFASGLLGRI
ncbi:MAG: 2-C-methyl-D-erythritol 4-phosphate cytidylyltransferase [Bacteroidales bacterium]|nr:2-C-methyl-D-erythritol 4-phosphate cytidylyltransferase [Bacteroidales bacterium]MBN2699054.1 2-C-methyl-D-erythritol 4-phosphate cytidylyltransferase [Bacteroidales bacterium]